MFTTDQMLALFNKSLVGGTVILLILCIRLLMKKFPKKYTCILWFIAFVRLLITISIPSVWSFLPIVASPLVEVSVEKNGIEVGEVPQMITGIKSVDGTVNELLMQMMEPAVGDSADPVQIYAFVLGCIWAGGVFVLLLLNVVRYIRLRYQLSDAVPATHTESLLGDKQIKQVYFADKIAMPIVSGLFRAKIYLPSFLCKEECRQEREMILAHENAHRLRLDHWTKWIAFLALLVHWFNPLVWIAYVLYCKDVEMACDERVMQQLGESMRKAYSLALLDFQEKRSALWTSLAFGESHTKERIKHILNYKRPRFWMGMAAGIVVIAVAVAFLTVPKGKAAESISIIGGADGPTSIFLAGKIGKEEETKKEHSAAILDLEKVKKQPLGIIAELDWVHYDKIAIHGAFGYISFQLEHDGNTYSAKPIASFTLEEAGPIVLSGEAYTEVVGGEDSVIVVTNAYDQKADRRVLWYLEEFQTLEEVSDEIKEMFLELLPSGKFQDAFLEEQYLKAVLESLKKEAPESSLLYGPVEIPEMDSIYCGFLASDGENVEDLWYGMWREMDGSIIKIPLFE